MFTDKNKNKTLEYSIHAYSSSSPTYTPQNILINDPTNANSRWTTTSNDAHQFIILKLQKDAIVTSITFGKFYKLHVCNVKTMSIYSYSEDEYSIDKNYMYRPLNNEDHQQLIFRGGLRNDAIPEKFPMHFLHKNTFIISRFIKIHPQQAWGVNFNFSLWHVKIDGLDANEVILSAVRHNYFYLTAEVNKIIYKYLNEQNKHQTIMALENEIEAKFEPTIKEEMKSYIENEKFEELEALMCKAVDEGIIDKEFCLVGRWTKIEEYGPEKRGGHAMVIVGSKMYIHGGWNGKEEIGDMWVFDCSTEKWRFLNKITEKRSCHKMVFLPGNHNSGTGQKYTENDSLMLIGTFAQKDNEEKRMTISTFDLERERMENYRHKWEVEHIFDHQTVFIDDKLYIYGGKVFINNQINFGGIYVLENYEFKRVTDGFQDLIDMRGRIGHSIIFFENEYYCGFEEFMQKKDKFSKNLNKNFIAKRNLLVIGGVREKQSFRNITFIDLDTDTIYKRIDFPILTENKIVHRSILIKDRIYFLFCFENNKNNVVDQISFYSYHIFNDSWTYIKTNQTGPVPRSAHSFGYCEYLNSFYLFGGNTGIDTSQVRFDDVWKLEISFFNDENIKKKIKYDVRKYRFLRMLDIDLESAINYLQTEVYEVVDHKCPYDTLKFKRLVLQVYKKRVPASTQAIVDDLSKYFIDEMKPLDTNLFRSVL